MPCPHYDIRIVKRSDNESAVAAYQSGDRLFSEYDQEQKYYPYKSEIVHKEILLPPHIHQTEGYDSLIESAIKLIFAFFIFPRRQCTCQEACRVRSG